MGWLDSRQSEMVDLAQRWAEINTFSRNLAGLTSFSEQIIQSFSVLNIPVHTIDLPPYQIISAAGEPREGVAAPALNWRQRLAAPHQILLVGHMDTVYPPDGKFQTCRHDADGLIRGPGITDMKGGLVLMLYVLQALEQCEWKDKVGWQVILNTDEELGSPASGPLLTGIAREFDLGLVFEPTLPNGDLVSARKGSGNFTLVVRGTAAHAGRNPQDGRSAIDAAADWITEVKNHFKGHEELTITMGEIAGGTACNVVADLAVVRFNVRCHERETQAQFEEQIPLINQRIATQHGVTVHMHGEFQAPPKPLTDDVRELLALLKTCAGELGMDLKWQATGGVCDGNRLAAGGLPTIDTLGVTGGHIHSPQEYVEPDSFARRAKLVLRFIQSWVNHREGHRE